MRRGGFVLPALTACSAASGETGSSDGADQGVAASSNANQTFALQGSQTFNWRCNWKVTYDNACYFTFTIAPRSLQDVNTWLQKHKDLLSPYDPTLHFYISFADVSLDGANSGMLFSLTYNEGTLGPACTSIQECSGDPDAWRQSGYVHLGTDHTIKMNYHPTLRVVNGYAICGKNGFCEDEYKDVATVDLSAQPDFPTLSVTTSLTWQYAVFPNGGGAG